MSGFVFFVFPLRSGRLCVSAAATLKAAGEQFVPFVRDRLHAVQPVEPKRLARWIANLDSDDFDLREQATRELESAGELAEAALRTALKESSSPEVRRRGRDLLNRMHALKYTTEGLQMLRTIDILEHLGTNEAIEVLNKLAQGAPAARLTRETQASLARLQAHPASSR